MQPIIAIIDQEEEQLFPWKQILEAEGYDLIQLTSLGEAELDHLKHASPSLYIINQGLAEKKRSLCATLSQFFQSNSAAPVILVAQQEFTPEQAKEFCSNVVEVLYPPFEADALLTAIERHLHTISTPVEQTAAAPESKPQASAAHPFSRLWADQFGTYLRFREALQEKLVHSDEAAKKISAISPPRLYELALLCGLTSRQLAKQLADFLGFSYTQLIDRYEVKSGLIAPAFTRAHQVVPIGSEEEPSSFVVSNPFDYELLDVVKNLTYPELPELIIADPKTVDDLLNADNKPVEENGEEDEVSMSTTDYDLTIGATDKEVSEHPVVYITDRILFAAANEGASDVHIEPKETSTTVRFRIDGDLSEKFTLKRKTGKMVISRLKALAGMDIAEHRKPQDGAAEAIINKRHLVLRLATTATVYGESLVFRVLDRDAGVVSLEGLGMAPKQAENMQHFAQSAAGLLLVVGPTGSGKTTTLYSLFSLIDCRSRSLISVEDPVEYRIAFANQQQVNDKAGISFESLLKSAVRQDPDILFMGEVRDAHSAQTAIQFSSIGRLVLTTLHTSSATSAIFRLEELGLSRAQMADSLMGIISQRLVKRLCEKCKEERPLSDEDKHILGLILEQVPEKAYFPVGCPACNLTGYHGREGIFEVIRVDAVLSEAIRKGVPIVELRRMVKDRGDMLMSRQAAEKVMRGLFCPRDVHQYILTEAELYLRADKPSQTQTAAPPPPVTPAAAQAKPAIVVEEVESEKRLRLLVVDDDAVTRKLLSRLAESAGYEVVAISDGIEALLKIGGERFDLIVTDLNMPNLNGFTLLEMLRQKGIETPVIFITASSAQEDIKRALALGAADFVQKPVEREAFLARLAHALDRQPVAS